MTHKSDSICCLLLGDTQEWFNLLSFLGWARGVILFSVFYNMTQRSDSFCCLFFDWLIFLSFLGWARGVIHFVVFPGVSQKSDSFCCLSWGETEERFIFLSFLGKARGGDTFCCLSWGEPEGVIHFVVFPEVSQRSYSLNFESPSMSRTPYILRHSFIQGWISIS